MHECIALPFDAMQCASMPSHVMCFHLLPCVAMPCHVMPCHALPYEIEEFSYKCIISRTRMYDCMQHCASLCPIA
jgi:hypothetical protein